MQTCFIIGAARIEDAPPAAVPDEVSRKSKTRLPGSYAPLRIGILSDDSELILFRKLGFSAPDYEFCINSPAGS